MPFQKNLPQVILFTVLTVSSQLSIANCVTTGNTTLCEPTVAYTSTVGAGNTAAADNQVVIVNGAGISSGNASAITLRDNATITVNGIVQNYSSNSGGGYNTGGNTVEFRNDSTITINPGGAVVSLGPQVSAEGINPQGARNTITNYGLINSKSGAAIWQQSPGYLTIDNYGTISTGGNYNSSTNTVNNPNLTKNVIGGNLGSDIVFYNRSGAVVDGSLQLGSGKNTLYLFTGSTITGGYNGGTGGNNSIYYKGTGTDTDSSNITNFQHLYKDDSGSWTLTGQITGLKDAQVKNGTLILNQQDNSNFQGITLVDPAGTLQGTNTSIPQHVTNNGLVNFNVTSQNVTNDGNYSGVITGSGVVQKIGDSQLNLTGINTYSGGTVVAQGSLGIYGSQSIGSGPLTLNDSTTLIANSGFALSNAVTLNGQSNINTNDESVTISNVISGAGGFNQVGGGILQLDNANTYTGPTNINVGTLILNGSINSNTTIATLGTLMGGGTINGSLTNGGLVQPSVSGAQTNLTINGNYVGNGGVYKTNIYPPDTAPMADTITINGPYSSSGTTFVDPQDLGGLGKITQGNGILVVNSKGGATTTNNAFVLKGGFISSSVYDYGLYKGPVNGSDQNWYLRTIQNPLAISPTFAGAFEPNSTPDNPASYSASNPAPFTQITPDGYERIEVAVFPVLPSLARLYNFTVVDTLDQRRSDLVSYTDSEIEKHDRDWIRIIGKHGNNKPETIVGGPQFSFNQYAVQLGFDIYQNFTKEGDRTYFGPFATIGQTSSNVSNWGGAYNIGTAMAQAYSVGVAGTYFSHNQWYVDGLVQVNRYSTLKAASALNDQVNTQGYGWTASLEAGKKYELGHHWFLTPQAQVVAESISIKSYDDTETSQVQFPKDDFARGRVGLMINQQNPDMDSKLNIWARVSYWNVFKGGASTVFSGAEGENAYSFLSETARNWVAIDTGATTKLSEKSSLYFNIGAETSMAGGNFYSYYGRLSFQSHFF
jgi:outer membrane autotransporter protein